MSKFVKENFSYSGGYLSYDSKFVARFKYQAGDRASFQSFLIKNFTPEEYFTRLENRESPLEILESKGFISSTVKRLLKMAGYPATLEGKNAYVTDRVAQYKQAA